MSDQRSRRLFWIVFCLAAVPGFLVAQAKPAESGKTAALGVYQLTGNDEGFSIKFPDGKSRDVEWAKTSSRVACDTLRTLRYSIFISTRKVHSASSIFLLGIPGNVIPGKVATKTTEGIQDRTEFILKGWFIKIPYIEYPQVPDYKPHAPPLKRTTLQASDFKERIDPRLIHYDGIRRIYWVGMNPFEKN